jgi:uncharacterized membrane protein YhaH (DUF805 family)
MSQPGYPAGAEQLPPYQPLQQPQAAGDPGTLDLPYYGIGFKGAIVRAYKKYARFNGRASRSEFWWFKLYLVIAGLILEIPFLITYVPFVMALSRQETPHFGPLLISMLPLLVFSLATLLPDLGLTVRRLHDLNYSGWLALLLLVPLGYYVVLALCIAQSNPEGRRFDRLS